MDYQLLNEELKLPVPDGFHMMDEAELGKYKTLQAAPSWCITDPERHIIVSVAWKKSGLGALLLTSGEVAKKMEARLRKPMSPYGYRLQGFITETVGGVEAEGFRYSYTAQNIEMTGESFSLKKGKTFYYIHCYYRTERKDESSAVLQSIFHSSEWI